MKRLGSMAVNHAIKHELTWTTSKAALVSTTQKEGLEPTRNVQVTESLM